MRFKNVCWKYAPRQDGTCSVKVYVNIDGKQKYYPVEGVFVHPRDFDSKLGLVRPKHPLAKTYNARIRAFRSKVEDHFLGGGAFGNFEKGSTVRHSLLDYAEKFIEEARKGTHGLTAGTIKNYNSLLTRLRQFAASRPGNDVYLDEIGQAWEAEYTKFLCEEMGCQLSTVGKHLRNVKRLMTSARKLNLHANDEYHKLRSYGAKPAGKIYLNEEEIAQWAGLPLFGQPHLEKERDRFLLAYYFLLRFSDVQLLSRKSIFTDRDKKYLRCLSKKTGMESIVPVSPKALELLEKYNYDFSWGTNQQANRELKVIGAMAGLNDLVPIEPPTVKSQLITTHTARRSAATNLRLQGASLKTIADLGGWKDIQSLQVYLRAGGLESAKIAEDLAFFE